MIMKKAIGNTILDILKKEMPNSESYITGSINIELDISNSDIDIALYNSDSLQTTINKLKSLGFITDDSASSYNSYNHKVLKLYNLVHIIIYSSKDEFMKDRETHKKINKFFNEVPEVKELCLMLKRSFNTKGGDIYKCLDLILNKNKGGGNGK